MRNFLGFVAFVLVAQGMGGLLFEVTGGWFRMWSLIHRVGLLDGYEVYVSVLLVALGFAVGGASRSLRRERADRT